MKFPDIPGARMVHPDERWLIADEIFQAFLHNPITPARMRRLDREAKFGASPADFQLTKERVYDLETQRLLRDMRAVENQHRRTA